MGNGTYLSTESKLPTWDPMLKPAEFKGSESLNMGWNNLLVVRYTSDGEPLTLKIQTSTKHTTKIQHGYVNWSMLVGEIPMICDNMEFMQIIHVVSDETKNGVVSSPDGVLTIRR